MSLLQTYPELSNSVALGEPVSEQTRRLANLQPAVWVLQRQRIAYLEALLQRGAAAQRASQSRACAAVARAMVHTRERSLQPKRCLILYRSV